MLDIAETSRGGKRIAAFDLVRRAIVAACAREQTEDAMARIARLGDEKGPAWSYFLDLMMPGMHG